MQQKHETFRHVANRNAVARRALRGHAASPPGATASPTAAELLQKFEELQGELAAEAEAEAALAKAAAMLVPSAPLVAVPILGESFGIELPDLEEALREVPPVLSRPGSGKAGQPMVEKKALTPVCRPPTGAMRSQPHFPDQRRPVARRPGRRKCASRLPMSTTH